MLNDLHYGGRMNDHEVDPLATRRITTGSVMSGRLRESDGSAETILRNRDDSHAVEILDLIGHIRFGVDDSALDVALESILATRRDEQDTTIFRNLVVGHGRLCCGDQILDIGRADRDVTGCTVDAGRAGHLCKSVIRFQ